MSATLLARLQRRELRLRRLCASVNVSYPDIAEPFRRRDYFDALRLERLASRLEH